MDHIKPGDMMYYHVQAEALAQERFAFLVHERGFTEGPIKRSARATSFYYVRTPELGLQVELSYEDAAIDVHLVRLRDGKPPRQLGTETDTKRIRMPIPYFLQTVLAVQDPWLEEYTQRWRGAYSDDYVRRLTDLSNMVKRYLDLILQQPVEVMFLPRTSSPHTHR